MERILHLITPDYELTWKPATRRFLLKVEKNHGVLNRFEDELKRMLSSTLRDSQPPELKRRVAQRENYRRNAGAHRRTASPHRQVMGIILPRVAKFLTIRALMPPWLAPIYTTVNVSPLVFRGVREAAHRRVNVEVLDAAAIVASIAMRDFKTAGLVAFLLDLGEAIEEWTMEETRHNLAALYGVQSSSVWVLRGGVEVKAKEHELSSGDLVVARAGSRIPVDGIVAEGEAMVNQAAMTGESQSIRRAKGLTVYAGTVVEEGELVVRTEKTGDETRFAKVVKLLENASVFSGEQSSEAQRLSQKVVPLTFLLSGLVYLFTGSWRRAATVLLVDYSCALKLTTPLAIKSAMIEASAYGAVIKGGKHLETLSRADVFMLDKTGTLTTARPSVSQVYPLNGFERNFVLRHAACLEEHFPHPVARAIVNAAKAEDLHHEEKHAEVKYIVAHGIESVLDGERILIGSKHFVQDDCGIDITQANEIVETESRLGHSVLFISIGDVLAGVVSISDPVSSDAAHFISSLRNLGASRIIMLTGDNQESANEVASQIGIDEVYAQMLPDQKHELVTRLQELGHTVVMVGDGMNDAAALAWADLGVSLSHGAEVAQAASGVLLIDGNISALTHAVDVSKRVMAKTRYNFRFTIATNTALLAGGMFAIIPPGLLALLHNLSTVSSALQALKPLLPDSKSR